MLSKIGIVAGILVALFLGLGCISAGSQRIAATLRGEVGELIQAEKIAGVEVAADGRDIVLTGQVGNQNDRSRAATLAASMYGVRGVTNRIVVTGSTGSLTQGDSRAVDTGAVQTQFEEILANSTIEFQPSSAVLLDASTPTLQQMLKLLQSKPGIDIDIQGYTDSSGNAMRNRELSQQRAEAVMAWLAERGTGADRMQANGFGPDRPIASNDTREGRAQNRRVEIVVSQR